MRNAAGVSVRTRIATLAFAAAFAAAAPAAARTTVPIRGLEFKKPSVRVEQGESVVWKDQDRFVSHTVTSRGKDRFRSSPYLQSGDEHRVRFRRSGTYRYVCKVHSFMQGRIVVS